jgi:hypothetical protein
VPSTLEGVTSGFNAMLYSFALCAAMLFSKQLLWHFLVLVGLERILIAQYPLIETEVMLQTYITAQLLLHLIH